MNYSKKRRSFEDAISRIKAFPVQNLTPLILPLLNKEIGFEDRIARACDAANVYSENPDYLLDALTELANLNERRCLYYRNIIDDIHRMAQRNDGRHRLPIPARADISGDIELSYDEENRILRAEMPILLPLKTKWAVFLPDKVNRAMENFSEEYRARTGKRIFIPKAFVLFIHHYDDERRVKNYFRDYDNQEWSCTVNAMQSTFLFSDNASTMILMQMAVPDSKSFTEVLVTDVNRMWETIRELDLSLYEARGSGQ